MSVSASVPIQLESMFAAAAHDAAGHHAGDGDADRAVPELVGEVAADLGDDVRDGRRRGRLRGLDAQPVRQQRAGAQVDGGTLDPRAADVDTQADLVLRGAAHSASCGMTTQSTR